MHGNPYGQYAIPLFLFYKKKSTLKVFPISILCLITCSKVLQIP
jgi:hypothetical protein